MIRRKFVLNMLKKASHSQVELSFFKVDKNFKKIYCSVGGIEESLKILVKT